MRELRVINIPVEPEDIDRIEAMVRADNTYIVQPSNIPDPYSLRDYIYVSAFENTEFRVLVDNNIATRAIALAKGYGSRESEVQGERFNFVAATMAYFILGGFIIEPNIAIYEKALKLTHADALEELKYFRIADHINPHCYVDIALGRAHQIPQDKIDEAANSLSPETKASNESDFTKILNHWKYSYLFLLKVVDLWKSGGADVQKAEKFISWMADDSYFSDVSSIFSLLFLAPNRLPKMVKGINSESTQKLSEGIKNAAWDCTYVKHWLRLIKSTSSDTICFLCSHDKVMKKIALSLLPNDQMTGDETLLAEFKEYWGEKDGGQIFNQYKEKREFASKDKEKRQTSVKKRLEGINEMIKNLESKLGIEEI